LLDTPEITTLLHHEYAHLQRRDLRAAFWQRIIEDICWWNWPLRRLGVWLSEQREMACDEYAAAVDDDYARALARETRRRVDPPPLAVGIDGPGIARRLERLTEPRRRPLALSIALVALTIFAGAIAAPRLDRDGATHIGINTT
jgi:beta-lactamase regulating signal transducer with metallopeptidase domain